MVSRSGASLFGGQALAGLCLALAVAGSAAAAPSRLVVWAWERPEDLRFLPPDVEVAVQSGFVELSGETVRSRGRRLPLRARPDQVTTAVVHVQIDRRRPLRWTPALRAAAVNTVARLANVPGVSRVQLDFEVPASRRGVLLDLIAGVRAALPPPTPLSITALASWCLGETWLAAAPVDEVTPMLFRMGAGGEAIRARLAAGGDLEPPCRTALAVSLDTPIPRAPAGRRVYLFDPRSWTEADFVRARRGVEAWDASVGSPPPAPPGSSPP